MLNKLKALFVVLRIGSELRNAAFWKNVQGAANALVLMLGVLLTFFPGFEISKEALQMLALAIAYIGDVLINNTEITPEMVRVTIAAAAALIWALFNNYFVYATSAKVGINTKSTADKLPPLDIDTNNGDADSVHNNQPAVSPSNSLDGGKKLLGDKK